MEARPSRRARRGTRLTEKELDAAIRELTTLLGWRRYHTYRSTRSPAGFPDLCLVKPPRVIFAELKSDIGTVTREQTEWLNDLRQCPTVETYLWRPSDLDEIARILSPAFSPSEPHSTSSG